MKNRTILFFISILVFNLFVVSLYPEIKQLKETGEQKTKKNYSNYTNSEPEKDSQHANTGEAKALLQKALEYIKLNGEEEAIKQFNNPGSQFYYKDLYIFAIDTEGNVLAHGGELDLIGTNQLKLKDSFGKYFIQEFISNLESSKTAVVEYHWRNYDTMEIESKLSYLQKYTPDKFIGCGIYYGKR